MIYLDRNIELIRKELTWLKEHSIIHSANRLKINYCLVKIDIVQKQVMGLEELLLEEDSDD